MDTDKKTNNHLESNKSSEIDFQEVYYILLSHYHEYVKKSIKGSNFTCKR